ncbi:NADH-quinone oxidoreductase subunit B family protein [Saccharolobus shibatae]|uniref:Uptake [NiFe] hydrogenase, small subunit HyaA n=1 Tax=Saccharolobus shibatae TaxID=2286 RepID=A0A8F5GZM7_9CREN|nr:hydrogenase [Saccharolobus shibatae]QXJ35518.1 Uptake [NiFe] hydrogenase, small subunit HyaA [Saccharolobus shibatae]
MKTVLWLQGGACGGNTLSFLNAESPDVVEFFSMYNVKLLWHPSLSLESGEKVKELLKDIVSGKINLDIFIFEGTVVLGPNGSGRFNMFAGRPMKDWVREIANVSNYVVAVGDCASFGGIPASDPNPTESTGLQFHKKEKGGFLGKNFKTRKGLPVINISGCPAHPEWITTTLSLILNDKLTEDDLDEYQRLKIIYGTTTQFGCPRNLYFAYKVALKEFGHREGCLYFELGCRGSYTKSPCNVILWNNQSSKTRVGTPCFGCTEFDFPTFNFFSTEKNRSGIPKKLPLGVSRGAYTTLSAIARGSAPNFLVKPLYNKKDEKVDWLD